MEFDMPKDQTSYIKVFGLGGGGGNAVSYMQQIGIVGANLYVCNTDEQAMNKTNVTNRIMLGAKTLQGLGAGANPEVGRMAALESIEEIESCLDRNTKMLFVVAGLGKGTGTGSAPVVAKAAKDKGILTVAIVTMPFYFEGDKQMEFALEGLSELRKNADALIVIDNDKLLEIFPRIGMSKAFANLDKVIANAVKCITEVVTMPGYKNVDFNDIKTVMKDSGIALMGIGEANGENRAELALDMALKSPLLRNKDIFGATKVLLNVTSSKSEEGELLPEELEFIARTLNSKIGKDAFLIWGNSYDESLSENLKITVIVTGFKAIGDYDYTVSKNEYQKKPETLDEFLELGTTSDERLYNLDLFSQTTPPMTDTTLPQSQQSAEAVTFELPIRNQNVIITEPIQKSSNPTIPSPNFQTKSPLETTKKMDDERKRRMQMLSNRYSDPVKIEEISNQPAVVRNNTELENLIYSHTTQLSDYYLGSSQHNADVQSNTSILKKDNGYIHPNVD